MVSKVVKILATGDFQLDKSFGTLGEHAVLFRKQLMATFNEVIMKHASDHDLVLIAGDLFDRKATPTSVIEAAADTMARCTTHCVVLPGNHDPVNSGIPSVLAEALHQRGATHVHVAVKREPIPLPKLGLTLYPAPLFRKDDISDQWSWIPDRTKEDGFRVALMHGALDSLPNGMIPKNLAKTKDLDLVICGDQHGPSSGDDEASDLFNLDTSRARKLYYAMAPEAQHINQNFTGAYLSITLDKKGSIVNEERIQVGELRFINVHHEFRADENEPTETIKSYFSQFKERPPELTSIRLTLDGELTSDTFVALQSELTDQIQRWPLLDLRNNIKLVDEISTINETEPVIKTLMEAVKENERLDSKMKAKIMELLRLNLGRWN